MTNPSQRTTSHRLQVANSLYRFLEDEVLPGGRRGDGEALLATDHLVVVEVALVGEEALAGDQLEVVLAALLIDQAHPLAGLERSAAYAGPVGRA